MTILCPFIHQMKSSFSILLRQFLFFFLGFYVLYPNSKRKIQKYFGILCLLLGAWFQSFILREIVPSWSYNWLINWGLIPSIPIPYYLFKITSSYDQHEQQSKKPRKVFHTLNFLLICFFFFSCIFTTNFTRFF